MKIVNELLCGDCLDFLPNIPDGIIDLVVIDPPYNNGKNIRNDKLNREDFLSILHEWLTSIIPKLKETGSLYCFMGYDYYDELKSILNSNLIFRREIVWHYKLGGNTRKIRNYLPEFDKIFYYTKSDTYTFNVVRNKPSTSTILKWKNKANKDGYVPFDNLMPYLKGKWKTKANYDRLGGWNIYVGKPTGNVLSIPKVARGNNPEQRFGTHPTQKPEQLIETFVKISSNEKDLVADFFAGSGTTLAVAKKLRRNYLGIEIEQEFCEIAKKRLMAIPVHVPLF